MLHEITIVCVKRSATPNDLMLMSSVGKLYNTVKIDTETVTIVIVITAAPSDFYDYFERNGATKSIAVFNNGEDE